MPLRLRPHRRSPGHRHRPTPPPGRARSETPQRPVLRRRSGTAHIPQPFSWKALGVDVRGRSSTLKINYRTSHQIRITADRLLGPEVSDVDANTEESTVE